MTHTFNLNGRAIRLIVSHEGKKYKKATGLTTDPALWNQKARSLRAKCRDGRVYERLRMIDLRMAEKEAAGSVSPEEAINYAVHGENAAESPKNGTEKEKGAGVVRPCFWDFFEAWSVADVPSRRDRSLAYRRLASIMGREGDWEDIDTSFYSVLMERLNGMGYSDNYKATLIAKLKTVMIEGAKRKYHGNLDYKRFSYKWETADTIALSQEEVEAIWSADLDGAEARARDCFIVGVYTAARFSDYSRISSDNIQNGRLVIQFKQRKTQGEVLLPISPRVLAVLDRNGGRVPRISEQEVGRHMKRICSRLGGSFDDIVQVTKSRGAYHVIEKKRRWELISTHTARRTGATLLYTVYNVPLHSCMMLTGHRMPSNFLKYIKVSREENARMLADNPFFK